jgi:hypothetical protein|nr:MAG TPA: hypothetical protein [Caudoviricetes sp.]
MTATNHTANYNLSQFKPTDRPTWQGDYNGDMQRIDAALHGIASSGGLREVAVSAPLSGKGTSGSPIAIDLSGYATTSALSSGLAAKVDKTASSPKTKGLTAGQLDSLWLDDNGIVRFTA